MWQQTYEARVALEDLLALVGGLVLGLEVGHQAERDDADQELAGGRQPVRCREGQSERTWKATVVQRPGR
jgi:hypothetical protein